MASRGRLEQMFDTEVIAALRATFDKADADGSGEIDAQEACGLFAAYCEPGSSAAEVKRTANNLLSTLDTDRSGKLSFEEFAFRFGRKLQMELARKKRAGIPVQHAAEENAKGAGAAGVVGDKSPQGGLRARAAPTNLGNSQMSAGTSATPGGGYIRAAPPGSYTRSAPPLQTAAARQDTGGNRPLTSGRDGDDPVHAAAANGGGWCRENLVVVGIVASLLALLVFAIITPAPGESGGRSRTRASGRTHGR
jgi:hypothetical protein